MRKVFFGIFLTLVMLFAFSSCPSPLSTLPATEDDENIFETAVGYFAFDMNDANARAILPDTSALTVGGFPWYVLTFTSTTGSASQENITVENSDLAAPIPVPVGTWELNIKAYNNFADVNVTNAHAAAGTYGSSIEILENITTTLNPAIVELNLIIDDGGVGDYSWTISWTSGYSATLSVAQMTITPRGTGSQQVIDLKSISTYNTDTVTGKTENLPCGFYNVHIELVNNDGRRAGFVDILYIYRGVNSVLTLINEYFGASRFIYIDGTGTGEATNPFIVRSEASLRAVGRGGTADQTPGYEHWTLDKHYRQVTDITLTAAGASNWTCIGDNVSRFSGTYNGGGHTISNITMNTTTNIQGMFGAINSPNGKVHNLGLIDVDITSDVAFGSIAGYNHGTIEQVFVIGKINGNQRLGGIAGVNYGSIKNSYTSVDIVVTDTGPGGIAGQNQGMIENCYTIGSVSGTTSVGGILGSNSASATVQNSVSLGPTITRSNGLQTSFGRVSSFSFTTGTRNNNYARSDMVFIDNGVQAAWPDATTAHDNHNGANIDLGTTTFATAFASANGWDTSIWEIPTTSTTINNGGDLPRLKVFGDSLTTNPFPKVPASVLPPAVSVSGTLNKDFPDLKSALDEIKTTGTGDYLVKILDDQELAPYQFTDSVARNITLIAEPAGNEVTVQLIGNGTLIQAWSNNNLTIDNGITLKGFLNNNLYLIDVRNSTFTMQGTSCITGNINPSSSSVTAVYIGVNGTFNMRDGKITGNTSLFAPAVYLETNNATFNMTGGEISGNTTSMEPSGAVFGMGGTARIIIGGTAVIKNNFYNSNAHNLFLYDGTITLGDGTAATNNVPEPATGMEVWVSTYDASGIIVASGASGDVAKYFHADEAGKGVIRDGVQLKIVDENNAGGIVIKFDNEELAPQLDTDIVIYKFGVGGSQEYYEFDLENPSQFDDIIWRLNGEEACCPRGSGYAYLDGWGFACLPVNFGPNTLMVAVLINGKWYSCTVNFEVEL